MEFRRKAAFLDVVQAEALTDELEAAGDGERRRSENDRVEGFKEALAQDLADVNRGGRKEHALVLALEPVDVLFSLDSKRNANSWRISKLRRAMRSSSSGFWTRAANSVSMPFKEFTSAS